MIGICRSSTVLLNDHTTTADLHQLMTDKFLGFYIFDVNDDGLWYFLHDKNV